MPKASIPEMSDEEEARVQAGIAADPENPEWTDEDFARARPASEVLPPALYAALTRPRGRPKSTVTKVPVKLRLDPDVVEAFRSRGPGWQTQMNDFLATRDTVVELILGYEAAAGEMRKLIALMRKGTSLTSVITKSMESTERQFAMTSDAARDLRGVLKKQAMTHVLQRTP